MKGEEFTPGMYLKKGYVITSRGCPHKCWYCSVHDREGDIRELPITAGWNVLDDNLLACSDLHIKSVFEMLMKVKKITHKRIEFTGGFEASRLQGWHIDYLLMNPHVKVESAHCKEAKKDEECKIAHMLSSVEEPVRGFGSSNCKCHSHLFRLKSIDHFIRHKFKEIGNIEIYGNRITEKCRK